MIFSMLLALLLVFNVLAYAAKVNPKKPMVALTFDDGPSIYTKQILATLRENNARATFFVVGNRIANHRKTIQQAKSQGCEIIGHTWSHPSLTKLNQKQIRDQLVRTNQAINQVVGYTPRYFRPPYGSSNSQVRQVARELGLSLVNWSVDPQDWKSRNSKKIYSAIMNNVKDGDIILCHDLYESTAEAMKKVIPALIKQGYQLVTVSELLEASEKTIKAGNIYYNK